MYSRVCLIAGSLVFSLMSAVVLVPISNAAEAKPTVGEQYENLDLDQETIQQIEEFRSNLTAYKCDGYLNANMQELYLTHGCLEVGLCVGTVAIDDIERNADFSIQGLDMRWDWGGNYSIILSPNNLARYYDFTMAEGDEDTGQRQVSSSLIWTCKKEK